jgi:rhodanese-related sulfurtransferase
LASESIVRWHPEDLERRRAERGEVLVLDVRTADARVVHPQQIPGARWLPLANVVERAGTLPREATIVTYCT